MNSETCMAVAQQDGMCKALTACLEHSSCDVVKEASCALAGFAWSDEGRSALLQQAGLLAWLTHALQQSGANRIAHTAMRAVRGLSCSEQGCAALLQQPGMAAALVQCMGHSNDSISMPASGTIHQLAHSGDGRAFVLQQAAGSLIHAVLPSKQHSWELCAVKGPLSTIWQLLSPSVNADSTFVQYPGALAAVTSCLAHPDSSVVLEALDVIDTLALTKCGSSALVEDAAGCLEAVLGCLLHEDVRVQQAAQRCLREVQSWLPSDHLSARAAVWEAVGRAVSGAPSEAQQEVDASISNAREVVASLPGY